MSSLIAVNDDAGRPQFKVIDEATGKEVSDVIWVDPKDLDYAVRVGPYGAKFHKVTAVRVDWVNRVIWLNEPPAMACAAVEAKQCDACTQPEACRRVYYCPAYRCGFGEVAKP